MPYNNEYKNIYSILGLEPGYNDLLFIVKNDAIEPFFNFNINQINFNYCGNYFHIEEIKKFKM
jgi:hypothetical protein